MSHIHHTPVAVAATARVLRGMQPDWHRGEALKPEVCEVLQALALRPYMGHESQTERNYRRKPTLRLVILEPDISKVPKYDLEQNGKFS